MMKWVLSLELKGDVTSNMSFFMEMAYKMETTVLEQQLNLKKVVKNFDAKIKDFFLVMDTQYIILSKKKRFELNTVPNCVWVGGTFSYVLG